jgi:exo-beta-1,3-glucanase (GH17 family)
MFRLLLLALCITMLQSSLSAFQQNKEDLVAGESWAVAYSGFREGQHPDRGDGANNPSYEEILEDLNLLIEEDFKLIRLYDAGENSEMTLEVIKKHKLPIKALLGVWLDAEVSNHENCWWLEEPIPDAELAANKLSNAAEVARSIELANEYKDIVVSINVGNEALVFWNDHMMKVEDVIEYVKQVKAGCDALVTVAESYGWWMKHGKALAAEVDYLGVHTYPIWEGRDIDEAMAYCKANIADVHAALPNSKIALLEAGWATTASDFGERASEAKQTRYYNEMKEWAAETNMTVFFFEAFDEPWKGNPDNALGAEKHWGLFFVDRTPKAVLRDK